MTADADANRDIRRERIRRQAETPGRRVAGLGGAPAILGTVVTASTAPGLMLKYQATSVSGTESEGSTGAFSVRSANRYALNIGPGTALAGDQLVMRFVNWRWVCEKSTGSGGGTIALPGCPCLVPLALTMSVTNPTANLGIFQSGTLSWQVPPTSLAALHMGPYAYISDQSHTDESTGDTFWYRFYCTGGFFAITRIYATSLYGTPFTEGVRYRWYGGVTGNTCSPFLLSSGQVYVGGDTSTTVTLSP